MCRSAACAGLPSADSAVRCPLPVTMNARAFPLAHPGRFTTSWTSAARFGVRCASPAAPTVHAAGDQPTDALVRGREEMLNVAVVNVDALSAACALIVNVVASDCASSATNWIYTFAIDTPGVKALPQKR